MLKVSDIEVPEEQLEALCKKYGVKELALFGSRARGDHRENSDIDLLVEFLPDAVIGLIRYASLQQELVKLFRVKVDLVSKKGLKPIVGDEVLPEAKPFYEAA